MKTNETSADTRAQAYMTRINDGLDHLNAEIANFASELQKQPVATLEWADPLFNVGAKHGLYTQIKATLDFLEEEQVIGIGHLVDLLASLEEKLMSMTKYMSNFSTSQSTNLVRFNQVTCLTREIEYLRRLLNNSR